MMHDEPQAWWDNEPVMAATPPPPETRARGLSALMESVSLGAATPPPKRGSMLSRGLSRMGSMKDEPLPKPVVSVPEGLVLVHTGFLTKQGHVVKNWKKRFMRLTVNRSMYTATLSYFTTADSALYSAADRPGEQGSIALAGATIVSEQPSNGFTVTTAAGKNYPLRAATEGEMDGWVARLKDSIAACVVPPEAEPEAPAWVSGGAAEAPVGP